MRYPRRLFLLFLFVSSLILLVVFLYHEHPRAYFRKAMFSIAAFYFAMQVGVLMLSAFVMYISGVHYAENRREATRAIGDVLVKFCLPTLFFLAFGAATLWKITIIQTGQDAAMHLFVYILFWVSLFLFVSAASLAIGHVRGETSRRRSSEHPR